MRSLSPVLALGALVFLAACGEKAADPGAGGASGAGAGIPLVGAAWDGGTGVDPTKRSTRVRVLAFFKPG